MDRLLDIRRAITRHASDGLTATALPGVSVIRATRVTQPISREYRRMFGSAPSQTALSAMPARP